MGHTVSSTTIIFDATRNRALVNTAMAAAQSSPVGSKGATGSQAGLLVPPLGAAMQLTQTSLVFELATPWVFATLFPPVLAT